MKTFATLLFVLLATQAWAMRPTYDSVRKSVEQQNPTNAIPAAERVFVSDNYTDGVIVHFREGITLREIIDETKLKGKDASVIVLRSPNNTTMDKAAFFETVKPSDKPPFVVKPGDVIYFSREVY
jgi:hypothetical protein